MTDRRALTIIGIAAAVVGGVIGAAVVLVLL